MQPPVDPGGLARALLGDFDGAVADFTYFVSKNPPGSPMVVARQAWIDALRAGSNPFTPAVLERLRR